MSLAATFFFISLAGLVCMIGAKWVSLQRGTSSFISRFLSRFDGPLSKGLMTVSARLKSASVSIHQHFSVFLHNLHHVLAAYLHNIVRAAERQVRGWREFARERKIENKSTSVFLKDMTEYKNQLKQNNHQI